MNSTPLIHYWGPPAAGRGTSIGGILGGTEAVILGESDYYPAPYNGRLALRFSSVATKLWYRAEDRIRPEALRPVIDRLGQAIGIVLVADSQVLRWDHNLGSLARLRADLRLAGRDLERIPVVFQLNKRDLPDIMSAKEMRRGLRTGYCDYVETIAHRRLGVKDAVRCLLDLLRLRL
jgi:hypothetical protein